MIIIEDGSGAIEYYYGKMGKVAKTRRTLIVPNQSGNLRNTVEV